MSNPSTNKPLTFAAMLVRAQRRFEAMGRPFPSTRLATGRLGGDGLSGGGSNSAPRQPHHRQ